MTINFRLPSEHRPPRVTALAVLPLFMDLNGKRAVVAGGSDAVAWKAELLAAAGARVDIYAPRRKIGHELNLLLLDKGWAHHDREWRPADLHDAALAVADAASEGEAKAFHDAARVAGVPVNVIDRPAFCQFQFGSIVNRSPVVVGISSTGAAPILAQAIRRRVEAVLPRSLAAWASLAQQCRELVMKRLRAGAQRRAFWEAFADRAFGAPPTAAGRMALAAEINACAKATPKAKGRVSLVGAGPGAADLLTMRAVRALQSADVILFDDLVSDDVLELARREAARICVGKRGGRPSCRQEDITGLMLTLAKEGRYVVRLKSGDPTIFARSGEEIATLRHEGIEVDIVSGVTSGIAMAAALGISLTHRDCARSVRFVTAHSRHGGLPEDLDWGSMARPLETTIFYMSGRMAVQIARKLLAEGASPELPAAIASAISRPEERAFRCDLRTLARGVEIDTPDPVLIGVGAVFEDCPLSSKLDVRPNLCLQTVTASNLQNSSRGQP